MHCRGRMFEGEEGPVSRLLQKCAQF